MLSSWLISKYRQGKTEEQPILFSSANKDYMSDCNFTSISYFNDMTFITMLMNTLVGNILRSVEINLEP